MMRFALMLFLTTLLVAATGCGGDESSLVPLGTETPLETDAPVSISAEEMLDLLTEADAEAIWPLLDERMQLEFPTAESLAGNFWMETLEELGSPLAVVSQHAERLIGLDLHTKVYEFGGIELALTILLDEDERIAGASVVPLEEAPTNYLDYETQAQLRLPFDGEWVVLVGGRTAETNAHVGNVDQRFATDFLIVRDERTFRSDGLTNEDHFCFGEPILAPAAGTVVEVIEGMPDNAIGQRNEAEPAGNAVILDHGNSEFSLLAHLQNGSVAVVEGASVEEGQLLGLCGNSGNSSEPHLHYHLQDGAPLFRAEGIPAFFNGYIADGESVDRGEPMRGQTVSNP